MILFYDWEVFKYDYLVVIMCPTERETYTFVNNSEGFKKFYNSHRDWVWIGYNSRHYDQYITKAVLAGFNPKEINDYIIVEGKKGWSFSTLLRKFPLNNYDVFHAATDRGLKTHEAFMGNNIKESSVPFDIDRKLNAAEIAETIKYCTHDVEQTIEVFLRRKNEFDARMNLIKMFKMNISAVNNTDAQLTAIVLDAKRQSHDDEFEIEFPPTLCVEKYSEIVDWYKNPINLDYSKSLEINVANVPHIFAWGGIHGAIPQYSGEGIFINMDVTSYYPSLMIRYNWLSRNVSDPKKFEEIYHQRVAFKKVKDPRQEPLKNVLNGTYGASKDKFNALYDPRQANNVCVGGQLLLLDLIEHLEGHCKIIQSNTDGILVKVNTWDDYDVIDDIAFEWENRTGMKLEFDLYKKVFQKDVNNYVLVDFDGKYKTKGAYVKKLNDLDYDLPIVNEALVKYMTENVPIKRTINNCNDLKKFQKVVKVSGKYLYGLKNPTFTQVKSKQVWNKDGEKLTDRTFRVFASTRENDNGIFKLKNLLSNPEKFANTPEKCFINNESINGESVPSYLDKNWYIDMAKERLKQFGVG